MSGCESVLPTAKQTLGCGHEMPSSNARWLLRKVTCQLVPSQRSTTG